MNESNDSKGQPKKEPRCDPRQLELLRKCSAKKDMTEWNKWREENPKEEIWLEGADLERGYLEGVNLEGAYLEGVSLLGAHLNRATLVAAHLQGSGLSSAHLQRAKLDFAHLERAYLQYTDLEGATLWHARAEGASLRHAYLKGAYLVDAHLEGADLGSTHLEGADIRDACLEGADFRGSVVDGLTLFWYCDVDRKTDFRGVGLESCRIDEGTKYLLQYNRRRMNCEDWYKQHPRLACPVKAFFWMSDYGNSTWRIIKTFFFISICFATVYYLWGAIDYYVLGVTNHPGIVANLFIDQQGPVVWWLVPLRSIYFSVVTMTTGFGDMYANTTNYWCAVASGHVFLGLQVLLGYVLLGALVTRFGVLFHAGVIPGRFKKEQK